MDLVKIPLLLISYAALGKSIWILIFSFVNEDGMRCCKRFVNS